MQDTTLPGISEENLRVLELALRLRAETAAWLTTAEVGHLLASILVSQVLRLSLRYHPPHFLSSQGSHPCRPSVGISHSSLPTQGHIPFLGVTPVAGVPHSTLLALLPLPQKLGHLCLAACLTGPWFLFSGQRGRFTQICAFATFYGAEGYSSGFLSPMPQTAFSLVSSHQLS